MTEEERVWDVNDVSECLHKRLIFYKKGPGPSMAWLRFLSLRRELEKKNVLTEVTLAVCGLQKDVRLFLVLDIFTLHLLLASDSSGNRKQERVTVGSLLRKNGGADY